MFRHTKIFTLALSLLAALSTFGQEQSSPSAPVPHAASPSATEPKPESQSPKPDLTPDAGGAIPQEQMRELFRVVADHDIENIKRQRDYTYVERHVEHKLDGKGQVTSTEIQTFEIMELYGEPVRRMIEKDDKRLSEKDAAKEEEKIRKLADKRKNESDEDRRKHEEKDEKEREDGRKFVREVADAYNFRLVSTELVGGRETWMIDAEPRPGYEPKMKDAKFLPKFHGRIWIDKVDLVWSKLDIEAIDTVSVGWVLARIHKGTRVSVEQMRVNDEVWLPSHATFKVDARVALFKGFNVDGEQSYRDYKKFRTAARMVGVGEVKQ